MFARMRLIVKVLIGTLAAALIGALTVFLGARIIDGGHESVTIPMIARIHIRDSVIRAEVADTDAARQRGLSGRASLPSGSGMLLVFDHRDYHRIWMQGMRFPIDLIWIAGGVVVDTTERLPVPKKGETPLPTFQPREAALLVLEVPAGTVARDRIRRGDRAEVQFDGT